MNWSQRLKNKLGRYAVPCQVSERWLQFPEQSSNMKQDGEWLCIDVMTRNQNDKARKLCELVVTKEDLLKVLESIKCK